MPKKRNWISYYFFPVFCGCEISDHSVFGVHPVPKLHPLQRSGKLPKAEFRASLYDYHRPFGSPASYGLLFPVLYMLVLWSNLQGIHFLSAFRTHIFYP